MSWRTEAKVRLSSARRRLSRLRTEIARWGLLAVLLGSALGFGAQHTTPLLLAAFGAAAVAALVAGSLYRVPRLVWCVVALGAFTALQLLPLPVALVELLSPAAADVWRDAFSGFRESPRSFVPLSVDPAATVLEVVKLAGLVCVLLSALVIRAHYGASFLATVVFIGATTTAAITLVHGATGMTRVYGLVDPGFDVATWSVGPLLNGNHLVAYANLGWFAGLGLLVGARGQLPVWVLAPGCGALALAIVLSQSRVGILLFAAGTLILGLKRMRLPRSRIETAAGTTLLAIAGLALLGVLLGGDRLSRESGSLSLGGRADLWRSSLDLLRDFPVFGVGRGAYETAFQPYRPVGEYPSNIVFSHPENLPLQWLAEWGIPAGLLVLIGCCVLLSRLIRSAEPDDWTATGLVLGLSALFVHNLVDFSLEIFAVSAAAAVVVGALSAPVELVRPARVRVPLGAAAATALAAAAALLLRAAPSQVERRELAQTYRSLPADTKAAPESLLREVRAAVARHPGDAYFPLLAGLLARRRSDDPLPFLGRALERAPVNGSVHLALAAALAERGTRGQALMHLRFAAIHDTVLRGQALSLAAGWGRQAAVVASAFPEEQPGEELLPDVCALLEERERVDCFRLVGKRARHSALARWPLANGLLDLAEARRGQCVVVEPCRKEVLALLQGSDARYGWQSAYLRARVVALDALPAVAAQTLLSECPARPEAIRCAEAAVRHAERAKDIDLILRAGERYVRVSCPGSACAAAHDSMAALLERSGAPSKALEHRRAAVDDAPTAARWLAVSEAATNLRSSSIAALALERALGSPEMSEPDRKRAQALRERLGLKDAPFELSISGER
jgi:O-antigen ligase